MQASIGKKIIFFNFSFKVPWQLCLSPIEDEWTNQPCNFISLFENFDMNHVFRLNIPAQSAHMSPSNPRNHSEQMVKL